MPICIAGVGRSGTSMVTQILHRCGLYLGDQHDLEPANEYNTDGYWEHVDFRTLNDELLSVLGSAWDCPPVWPIGRPSEERVASWFAKADRLVRDFTAHEPWGWKDPRNSLTLPFWQTMFPQLKVIICVRNPLDVAASLGRRQQFSRALGINLWAIYNQRVLAAVPPDQRIVTHYDRYFQDPDTEITRVLSFVGIPISADALAHGRETVESALRHHRFTTQQLYDTDVPLEAVALYATLCAEAGMEFERPAALVPTLIQSAAHLTESAAAYQPNGPFRGVLDAVDCTRIEGWAYDEGGRDAAVHVVLFDGDERIGAVTADRFRSDLFTAGIGAGYHAFRFRTPEALRDNMPHAISAKIANTDFVLNNSPKQITCGPEPLGRETVA